MLISLIEFGSVNNAFFEFSLDSLCGFLCFSSWKLRLPRFKFAKRSNSCSRQVLPFQAPKSKRFLCSFDGFAENQKKVGFLAGRLFACASDLIQSVTELSFGE